MIQRHSRAIRRLLPVALITGLGVILSMSQMISAEQQKPATQPDYRDFDLKHADRSVIRWGPPKTTLLTGNVVIQQGDTVFRSEKVDYNDDTQIATSPGPLTITDPENDLSADSGVAYFRQRRGVLQGNVKLVAKPKKKPQGNGKSKEWKDKATITCDTLEYLYKAKEATATGNLKIVQKDKTVTAEKAVYLVKPELVTLTGNVRGIDEKKQTLSAGGKVTVSLKDGDEWMEIEQATGSFKVEVDEEEQKPADTEAKAAKP